ncbi:MAG: hypothetical protein HOQ05_10330 [Corynebacteriales bacterium]|nr:hypothetical protein [Mycobacteriales bacterium]
MKISLKHRIKTSAVAAITLSGLVLGLSAPAVASSAEDGVRISSAHNAVQEQDTAVARFSVPLHVRPDLTSPIAGHIVVGVEYKVGPTSVKGANVIPKDCGTDIYMDAYRIVYDAPGSWTGYAPVACIY